MPKLSDIFTLQMGKTPSRDNLQYWNNGDNMWVSIADLKEEKYITKTKETISNIAVKESILLHQKRTILLFGHLKQTNHKVLKK